MKLKYYLRGLGIGILVTALIMGATGGKKLTEDEIRAKALQLGMVEGTNTGVLSDLQASATEGKDVEESIPQMESVEPTQEATEAVDATEEATQESSEVVKETEEATQESTEVVKETEEAIQESSEVVKETEETIQESTEVAKETVEASKETTKETTETKPTESAVPETTGEKKTITVFGGDNSVTVSNALVAAGLIADAKDYDRYLCSNGYDKRICVGTYEIEMGSDYETIAKIITKR